MNYFKIILIIFFTCLFSCKKTNKGIEATNVSKFEYAKGFSIEEYQGCKKVSIFNPYKDASKKYEYLLVPRDSIIPEHKNTVQVIHIPIERIVVTSTSHIPLLELLDEEKSLVGFPNTNFISSKKTRALVDSKNIKELGKAENLNTELLLELHPELVMSFAVDKPNKSFLTLQKMGVPILLNGDWLEETPLGRAEWIKLFGALYNKEKQANLIFENIKNEYEAAKLLAEKASYKPTVLSGSIFQDVWYLPAGESFIAQYFNDANTNYLWKDSKGTGSLSLNFENVFAKGQAANFWIGCGMNRSKEQLISSNDHYQKFRAFQEDKVFTFANYRGETGGMFYFELAPIQPHIILKDIIKVTHPELLPNYTPVFFEQLK